jgi:hypothetical protein|tara:strand:+ start:2036 stop:2167 length:132 start_codon:yes stop_codon:yes gene_type:complete
MDKYDRETMIKSLMKLKLQRKLLDRLKDTEIQRLFSVLKGYSI